MRRGCWGNNGTGQLGFEDPDQLLEPTEVHPSMRFKDFAVGYGSICGLTDEGKAYCWGRNLTAELGSGASDNDLHLEPEPVLGDLTFTTRGRRHRVLRSR